jgi:hypothetical protein
MQLHVALFVRLIAEWFILLEAKYFIATCSVLPNYGVSYCNRLCHKGARVGQSQYSIRVTRTSEPCPANIFFSDSLPGFRDS